MLCLRRNSLRSERRTSCEGNTGDDDTAAPTRRRFAPLPDNVLVLVFQFAARPPAICECALVCRSWNSLTSHWEVWQCNACLYPWLPLCRHLGNANPEEQLHVFFTKPRIVESLIDHHAYIANEKEHNKVMAGIYPKVLHFLLAFIYVVFCAFLCCVFYSLEVAPYLAHLRSTYSGLSVHMVFVPLYSSLFVLLVTILVNATLRMWRKKDSLHRMKTTFYAVVGVVAVLCGLYRPAVLVEQKLTYTSNPSWTKCFSGAIFCMIGWECYVICFLLVNRIRKKAQLLAYCTPAVLALSLYSLAQYMEGGRVGCMYVALSPYLVVSVSLFISLARDAIGSRNHSHKFCCLAFFVIIVFLVNAALQHHKFLSIYPVLAMLMFGGGWATSFGSVRKQKGA